MSSGALGTKQAKPTDLSTKTDAELQNTLDTISKSKQTGPAGLGFGILSKSITAELERRRLAKPPETPAAPDTTQNASLAQKTAKDAAAKQRKRAAAGAAGFVRPMGGTSTQSSGLQTMAVLSPTTLLGG